MKLNLSDASITLVMATDILLDDSIRSYHQCMDLVKFTKYKFFTSHSVCSDSVEVIKIKEMRNTHDYSQFILYDLNKYRSNS